jgi:hypothetical protein
MDGCIALMEFPRTTGSERVPGGVFAGIMGTRQRRMDRMSRAHAPGWQNKNRGLENALTFRPHGCSRRHGRSRGSQASRGEDSRLERA